MYKYAAVSVCGPGCAPGATAFDSKIIESRGSGTCAKAKELPNQINPAKRSGRKANPLKIWQGLHYLS